MKFSMIAGVLLALLLVSSDAGAQRDDQFVWGLGVGATVPAGTAKVSLAMSTKMPSSLVLPVIPGLDIPTEQPSCPSLRNQPCRPYLALKNRTEKG